MAKKGKKPSSATAASSSRVRKATRLQKHRHSKKTAKSYGPVPGSFRLVGEVGSIFRRHYRVLGGILLVYMIVNLIFANGFSNISSAFNDVKASLQATGSHSLSNGLSGFSTLLGNSTIGTSQTNSTIQALLLLMISLTIIWALRHLLAGKKVRVKDAFYGSMTPLVPFLIVIFFIILQLLPFSLSAAAGLAVASSLSLGGFMTALILLAVLLFGLWSIYMLSASVFALYIVTLPDMKPREAMRSARNLVKFRRWIIIRRLLFIPLFLFVVMAIVTVPFILHAGFLVAPIFYILSSIAILFVHSYLYSLYRGLLE